MEHLPSHCSFSLFQIGGGNNDQTPTQIINIPDLLSILATNHVNGEVQGLNQLHAEYQKEYGPGNYVPNVFIQYWSMRVMAYMATLVLLFALWGAWLLYRRKLEHAKWFLRLAPWVVIAALLDEHRRLDADRERPAALDRAGAMKTANGVSSSVSAAEIWISIVIFVAIFAVLGVVDGWLMVRFSRRELGDDPLAEVTSPGGAAGPTSARAESSDEDESALVY